MNFSALLCETAENLTSLSHDFFFMDNFLAMNYVVCNLIGLPLNLLAVAYMFFKPRLRQMRNISWFGVAFSNVLILIEHLVEFCVCHFQSEAAKKIIVLIAGLPHISMILNLLLLLIDRYVSIAHSAWYRRNVTITWIMFVQIVCFSILCVMTKGHYLLQINRLPTRVTVKEIKLLGNIMTIFFLICVFFLIFVYFKVNYYLRLEKDMDISWSTYKKARYRARQCQAHGNRQTISFMETSLDGSHPKTTSSQNELVVDFTVGSSFSGWSPFFIKIDDQAISRLDLKAARHALHSVLLFILFSLPSLLAFNFSVIASCLSANVPIPQECTTFLWTLAYTRGLIVIYPAINPIVFIKQSPNLMRALSRCSN